MAKKRFLRVSLSTALVIVALVAVAFSWYTQSGQRQEFRRMKKLYAPLQSFIRHQSKLNQLLSQLDTKDASHLAALELGRMFLPPDSPDTNPDMMFFGAKGTVGCIVELRDYGFYKKDLNAILMHGMIHVDDACVIGLFDGDKLIDVFTKQGASGSLGIGIDKPDINGDGVPDIELLSWDFSSYEPGTQPPMSTTHLLVSPAGLETGAVKAKQALP